MELRDYPSARIAQHQIDAVTVAEASRLAYNAIDKKRGSTLTVTQRQRINRGAAVAVHEGQPLSEAVLTGIQQVKRGEF